MATRSETKPLTHAEVQERSARAHEHLIAAIERVEGASSARRAVAVTNAVDAAIAACDAICGHVLGIRASGDDHRRAVALLERAAPDRRAAINALGRLLTVKTTAAYGAGQMSTAKAREHVQRAETIVQAMDEVLAGPTT